MIQPTWGAAALLALATFSPPPSHPALERAFAFASAIESDPKDRAMAQSTVALEALALEDGEQAAALADKVSGWQRGVLYAEIATWHARAGRTEPARAFLAKAEEFQRTQEGWQGPRIRAHVGAALSALGDAEGAHVINDALAENDRQYNGMAVVSNARLVARRSGFDAAVAEIKKTEQETDYEFALGRASAYLELGQDPRFSSDQRLTALRAARATAEEVAVWSRADLLVSASKGSRSSTQPRMPGSPWTRPRPWAAPSPPRRWSAPVSSPTWPRRGSRRERGQAPGTSCRTPPPASSTSRPSTGRRCWPGSRP